MLGALAPFPKIVIRALNVYKGNKHVLKNRIYGVDQDWTWGDIIHDLFSEFEEPILKSDIVEVSVSSSLNVMPMEVIYPDLLEPVKIVHSFDKSLR